MAKRIVFSQGMDAELTRMWGRKSPFYIADVLGVSVPTVYRRSKEIGLIVCKIPKNKILLSKNQVEYLKQNYLNTDNQVLAMDLGISESSLHRFARKYGLKKSHQYMRQCQAEAAKAAGYFAKKFGRKPPTGPNSGSFKKGVTNRERLGVIGERVRIQKSAASRRETWSKERWRLENGLEQTTKLRVVSYDSRKVSSERYFLRKKGYQVEGTTAYYTDNTNRSIRLEYKYKDFTFKKAI